MLGYMDWFFHHRPVTTIAGKALCTWLMKEHRQNGGNSQTE